MPTNEFNEERVNFEIRGKLEVRNRSKIQKLCRLDVASYIPSILNWMIGCEICDCRKEEVLRSIQPLTSSDVLLADNGNQFGLRNRVNITGIQPSIGYIHQLLSYILTPTTNNNI